MVRRLADPSVLAFAFDRLELLPLRGVEQRTNLSMPIAETRPRSLHALLVDGVELRRAAGGDGVDLADLLRCEIQTPCPFPKGRNHLPWVRTMLRGLPRPGGPRHPARNRPSQEDGGQIRRCFPFGQRRHGSRSACTSVLASRSPGSDAAVESGTVNDQTTAASMRSAAQVSAHRYIHNRISPPFSGRASRQCASTLVSRAADIAGAAAGTDGRALLAATSNRGKYASRSFMPSWAQSPGAQLSRQLLPNRESPEL